MRLSIGFSTGILSHLPSIFIPHITSLWDTSMVCGEHTCLVRPGNGVGANKWILGGQDTDTEWRKTRLPPQCSPLRLMSLPPYMRSRWEHAHYKHWTTYAALASQCLSRRCDGLRNKPWGLRRKTGDPVVWTGDGSTLKSSEIWSSRHRGLDRAPDSRGHRSSRASQHSWGGIRSHNHHLNTEHLVEGHMSCNGSSKTGLH